jgi:hypothetical protein
MKFYYQLENNRITAWLTEKPEDEYMSDFLEVELQENPEEVIFGAHSIVNGEFVFLDFIQEEKDKQIKNNKMQKINELKLKLNETDYQVIKCYEASLLEEETPYNLQELLAQRKAWREEINAIEFEISMLG